MFRRGLSWHRSDCFGGCFQGYLVGTNTKGHLEESIAQNQQVAISKVNTFCYINFGSSTTWKVNFKVRKTPLFFSSYNFSMNHPFWNNACKP